jgi:hypothetical protein
MVTLTGYATHTMITLAGYKAPPIKTRAGYTAHPMITYEGYVTHPMVIDVHRVQEPFHDYKSGLRDPSYGNSSRLQNLSCHKLKGYMTNPTLTPAQYDPFHENTVRFHGLSRDHTSGRAKVLY